MYIGSRPRSTQEAVCLAATTTKARAPRRVDAGSARSLASKLKASLATVDQIVALYEGERRERLSLATENARLKKIVDRVQSAVGNGGQGGRATAAPAEVGQARKPRTRRKRKPLSPENRARAAQNLVKARAARAAKLSAPRSARSQSPRRRPPKAEPRPT